MIVTYDAKVDRIYFKISSNKIQRTEVKTMRIITDYDENNQIVGIEVLDFQYLVNQGLTPDDLSFSPAEKIEVQEFFTQL